VTVARDDREAGDLRIAHEVVDLAALVVGAAVIAGADHGEGVGRPLLLGQSRGRFCGSARESSAPCELPQIFQVAVGPAELVLEPGLLRRAENRLRRRVLSRDWDTRASLKAEFGRRFAAVEGAAAIERSAPVLGNIPLNSGS
jgi:hypothetical protein